MACAVRSVANKSNLFHESRLGHGDIAAKWCIPKYQLLSSFLLSCSVDVLGGKLFELTGSDCIVQVTLNLKFRNSKQLTDSDSNSKFMTAAGKSGSMSQDLTKSQAKAWMYKTVILPCMSVHMFCQLSLICNFLQYIVTTSKPVCV